MFNRALSDLSVASRFVWLTLLITVAFTITACGGRSTTSDATEENRTKDHTTVNDSTTASETTHESEVSTMVSSPDREVFFIKQRQVKNDILPSAQTRGKLMVMNGCLRLKDLEGAGSSMLVWPSDFELDIGDGVVRVLNSKGKAVAKVGDTVELGGGEITTADALQQTDLLRKDQTLPARCSGPYWIVAEPINAI